MRGVRGLECVGERRDSDSGRDGCWLVPHIRAEVGRHAVPSIVPRTQHVILSVLAPSFDADGKFLNESSTIRVMNQSYFLPR